MSAKRGRGRPTAYTDAIAEEICNRLCEGEPLRHICRDKGIPWRTVHQWREDRPEFAKRYQAARDLGMDAIAEEALEIIDTDPERDAVGKMDGACVQWQKNRFEARLKLLAKWNPKKYGDAITHKGDPDAPVQLILNGSDIHG